MKEVVEMIFELLQKPDKQRIIVAKSSKLVLNLVFAEWLYRSFIGPYTLIDPFVWEHWVRFVMSGQILLVTFLYFSSDIFLFYILSMFTAWPITLLGSNIIRSKEQINEYDAFIRWYLRTLDLLYISKKKKQWKLMDNSDQLYELALDFQKRESKSEVRGTKDSIVDTFIQPLIVFVILYFTILDTVPHNPFLHTIVWIGLSLGLVIYFSAAFLMDIAMLLDDDLIWIIDTIRMEQSSIEFLKQNEIFVRNSHAKNEYFDKHFFINNSMVAITFSVERLSSRRLEIFTKAATEGGFYQLILFRLHREMKKPEIPYDNTKGNLRIVMFRDQNDMEFQLQALIGSDFYIQKNQLAE